MTQTFSNVARMGAVFLCAAIAPALQRPSVIDAVHKGHAVGHEQDGIDAVRSALEGGGDVNERDGNGWTPLMHAALECRAQITKLLLERAAAKLRAKGERSKSYIDHGQSALTIAAGCFINRQRAALGPERGMSPAYIQSERDAPLLIVRNLIEHGAAVDAVDADGRTPLMMAAMQGWTGVVKELLARKAAANVRDQAGLIAIDYADPDDHAILGLLQAAGSRSPTGRSGRTVCDAERALDKLGYQAPIIDCIPGQQLSAIVIRFQKDRALSATGELDDATRLALKIR